MTAAPPPQQRTPTAMSQSSIFWYMILTAFAYWIFVRYLQAPDTTALLGEAVPQWLHWIVGLFYPSVLVHLLPLALGWGLAYFTAIYVIQKLYNLPSQEIARDYLPQTFPVLRLPSRVTEERLKERPSIILQVGGPGSIIVGTGQVVTTELNGRFHRILGSGTHYLDRFEYIYTLLTLHAQERNIKDAQFRTKEGLPVWADIGLVYRLGTGGEVATKSNPYPYSDEAIRKAAYAHVVKEDDVVSDWQAIPIGSARGILGSIIAKYSLNELLQPDNVAYDPHLTIKNELERKLRRSLDEKGIDLVRVRLGQFKLHEQVTEQFIKYWQAHWQKQSQIIRADGAANALEEIEVARAEAEITMLRAVLEGLQRAQQENNIDTMGDMFAYHLIQYLEKIAWQSKQIEPLPKRLLPQIQELKDLIAPDSADEEGDDDAPD
ncbi:MAG: SPFH domain-containing protein [Chloroflexota bacterium]